MNIRSWLYRIARLMGDVRAVRRRQVTRRIYNRGVGKILSRFLK